MNRFKTKNTSSVFLAYFRLSNSRDEAVKGVRSDLVAEPGTDYTFSFIRYTLKKKCLTLTSLLYDLLINCFRMLFGISTIVFYIFILVS